MTDDQLIAQAQAEHLRRKAIRDMERAQQAEAERLKAAATDDSLNRLLATIQASTAAFEAELAALPPSVECKRHPGSNAVLNHEASLEAGRAVYRCPTCAGDQAAIARERRLINAGIPSDVRHATLDNFMEVRPGVKQEDGTFKKQGNPAEFVRIGQALIDQTARNAILAGTPGIGKGHIAAAVAIARIDAGWPVAWVECSTLFRAVHRSYGESGPDAIFHRYISANLLVLDEIALRLLPADGEEILFTILDGRHKAGTQTILLSNETLPVVREWLGERIRDRLNSGKVLRHYGEWASMRGEEADAAADKF